MNEILVELFKSVADYKSADADPKDAYQRGLRHGWTDAMKFASDVLSASD